jgi:hypothetical protein
MKRPDAPLEIKIPPEKIGDPEVKRKVEMVRECLAVGDGARGRRARIAAIAEKHGFSVGTAYRGLKRVQKGKWLIKPTRNHGVFFPELGITVRAWDEEAGRIAIEAILSNARNHAELKALYANVVEQCKEKGLCYGSYDSFLSIARRIKRSVTIYRDKGIRGLREDIVPPIRRDHTAYRPMECLVGDQHKADYYAIDGNGDVATLELFCWMDFRTQLVWPAIAYRHYNRYTVGLSFVNALRWGMVSIAYTDWGKPEESNYISFLFEQATGLGIKTESIRHTRAKVRHPQAKPIESWFGWLDRNLRNEQIPGYCKRLKDPRENELQQNELKEVIRQGGLLSTDELVDAVLGDIDGWNKHKFKNRGPDTGKSPLEIYYEETKAHPVATLSEDVLDYIFLPFQEVKVRRSQVKVKHEFLKKTLTYYDPELADHGGADVMVRFDPFDPGAVWVFKDRRLICQAEEWGLINPKNMDHVMARLAKQNALITKIKDIFKAYRPEQKTVPRISPHDREAKAFRQAQSKKVTELRVMKTPLDEVVDLETGEILTAPGATRRAQDEYRPMFELKKRVHAPEPERLILFPSTINGRRAEAEEDE